jgi:hypothetical protein
MSRRSDDVIYADEGAVFVLRATAMVIDSLRMSERSLAEKPLGRGGSEGA